MPEIFAEDPKRLRLAIADLHFEWSPSAKNSGSGLPSAVNCDDNYAQIAGVSLPAVEDRVGTQADLSSAPESYPGSERFGDWVFGPGGNVVERS